MIYENLIHVHSATCTCMDQKLAYRWCGHWVWVWKFQAIDWKDVRPYIMYMPHSYSVKLWYMMGTVPGVQFSHPMDVWIIYMHAVMMVTLYEALCSLVDWQFLHLSMFGHTLYWKHIVKSGYAKGSWQPPYDNLAGIIGTVVYMYMYKARYIAIFILLRKYFDHMDRYTCVCASICEGGLIK